MKRALLIVDPQYDFINGSLPVPGAASAMDDLSHFILSHPGDYLCKVITVDWHPYDHSSFSDNGGIWPRHCVQYSQGAAVWQRVLDAVHATAGQVHVLTKGTDAGTEEYSIFQNAESRAKLIDIIRSNVIEQVDVCGIAGDVCVLSTLTDGCEIFGRDRFRVLEQYCPSLDGGVKIGEFLSSLPASAKGLVEGD